MLCDNEKWSYVKYLAHSRSSVFSFPPKSFDLRKMVFIRVLSHNQYILKIKCTFLQIKNTKKQNTLKLNTNGNKPVNQNDNITTQ